MYGLISTTAVTLMVLDFLVSSVRSFGPALQLRPSYIQLESVSQKYPVTLMQVSLRASNEMFLRVYDTHSETNHQTLFSSVPKREYAVHDINLSFGHVPSSSNGQNYVNSGVTIIDGRSASGKSTILRLLAGLESPVEGRIFINGQEIKVADAPRRDVPSWMKVGSSYVSPQTASFHTDCLVQPVIIERKPDFSNTLTVLERIYQNGRDAVQNIFKKQGLVGIDEDDERDRLFQELALEFAKLLQLTEEQYSCIPSNLSPSGQFLFGMACACMVSVAPSVAALDLNDSTNKHSILIPSPILLFDELFDSEHSSTVDKCKPGIMNLIDRGGVVISVTHRPSYFMKMARRCITMSGGTVLAIINVENLENPLEYPKMK
ncbi:hypothetical protein ACHAW6_013262 [Cyclotella cf. meneghiniana]